MVDKKKIAKAVVDILEAIGENVNREGLRKTPERVANMFEGIFSKSDKSPDEVVKIFNEPSISDEIITVRDIPFYSLCEHHMLPFFGKMSVAYIAKDGKIMGLSKFSRILDYFSGRLQMQERLTKQISDFLYEELEPHGVLVMVEAEHLCMTMRGAKSIGSKTKTVVVNGIFKENMELKNEALELLK